MKKHRSASKEPDKMKSPFHTHFRNVGWENAEIRTLYEIEFETRGQLLQAEKDEIIKHLSNESCLNCNRPLITPEEKKQCDAEYGKQRRTDHKERERQRVIEWRKKNPEKYAEQCRRAYEKRRQAREAKNNVENNTN